MTLLVALALLFAGASGLFRARSARRRLAPPAAPRRRFILCLAAEFGDRTQFITFALAGRFDSAPLAAAGATAGIARGLRPGRRCSATGSAKTVPLRAIRYTVAALFLLAGFIAAVNALQLV